jgi:catechol 2,3-dioxygenase-like lactoylglutathione lyase family enzyme
MKLSSQQQKSTDDSCRPSEAPQFRRLEENVKGKGKYMARLRHFAIVVRDQEKSAQFYEEAFGLKRAGFEDLGWSSAIYLSDGVVNLALLHFTGTKGSGREDMKDFVGAHHFGFIVDDLDEAQKRVEAAGGTFFMDLGDNAEKDNFERKFKDPDGIIIDISRKGWSGTNGRNSP